MAQSRTGKDTVTLVVAVFPLSAGNQKVLPSPCFLLVTYRFPTFPFSPLFTPSHTQFHFSTSRHQKSTAIAVITVLPGFNVFSICKVYLELSCFGCFLNRNGNCYCSTNHWVITQSDSLSYPVKSYSFLFYYPFISIIFCISNGFDRCAPIPAVFDFFMSSSNAFAVIAIIGMLFASSFSLFRISCVASYPSMTGIIMSIRIASK